LTLPTLKGRQIFSGKEPQRFSGPVRLATHVQFTNRLSNNVLFVVCAYINNGSRRPLTTTRWAAGWMGQTARS